MEDSKPGPCRPSASACDARGPGWASAVPDLCLSLQQQPRNCLKTARRKMEPCDMFMSHRPVWQTTAAAGRQDGAMGLGRPQRAGKASGGEGRRAPRCRPGVPGVQGASSGPGAPGGSGQVCECRGRQRQPHSEGECALRGPRNVRSTEPQFDSHLSGLMHWWAPRLPVGRPLGAEAPQA